MQYRSVNAGIQSAVARRLLGQDEWVPPPQAAGLHGGGLEAVTHELFARTG